MSAVADDLSSDLESFFRGLGQKPGTTLRFFDRQNFFVLFADDAQFLALEMRKTSEALRTSRSGIVFVNVSQTQFEAEVRDILLVHQYRIEVYGKESGVWHLQYTASPGNFGPLEDVLYSCRDNLHARGLIAIAHSDRLFAVTYVDTICKSIRIANFTDDVNLCTLECLLVQLAPKEALIAQKCRLQDLIVEKLALNQVTVTPVIEKEFFVQPDSIRAAVQHLLTTGTNIEQVVADFDSVPAPERKLVEQSVSAAIRYLHLSHESRGLYELSFIQLSQFMKLDSTAVSALNLFPVHKDSHITLTKDKRSVFGLLNRCRTLPGQRLLSQWVRQPLVDVLKINERLDLVEHFVDYPVRRTALHDQRLRAVPDLVRLSRRLQLKTIKLQEAYALYLTIQSLPQLIAETGAEDNPFVRIAFTDKIEVLVSQLTGEFGFIGHVEKVLDFSKLKQRVFCIRSDITPAVQEANDVLQELDREVQDVHRQAMRDLALPDKQLKLTKDEKDGYFFSVTNSNEKSIRNQSDYHVIQSNKKDGIRFTSDRMQELSQLYRKERSVLTELEDTILSQFRDAVSECAPLIRQLSEVLTHLDAIVALAVAAVSAGTCFVRPEMRKAGTGLLTISKLRHPCIELITDSFIANDVNLSAKTQKFKLVTGPNMGGKSTYIRSAAIAILMAQMGSFVPADRAVISVMDGIFTRVGASDKQLLGNSTFMNEMVETAAIVRSATENSFVVIDELGRGTSTFDGYGIAHAVCRHICRQLKSFCLFATHFHELTELEESEPGIGNLHVAVHATEESGGKGILLLFEVREGISAQSYGIHTAKAAAFPPDLISLAEAKLRQLDDHIVTGCSGELQTVLTADLDSDADVRRLVSAFKTAKVNL